LIAFARAVELLESINDKISPIQATTSFQSSKSSGTLPVARLAYDEQKWRALVEFDPDIAAAVEKLRPFGRKCVDELAEKFLALGDKRHLDSIVRRITDRCEAAPESERLDDLEKSVQYVFSTPWGYIAAMKDGTAIAFRGTEVEYLPSMIAYYDKYKEDASTWRGLTDVSEKRAFYKAAASILR
jgi:hypothetical protein